MNHYSTRISSLAVFAALLFGCGGGTKVSRVSSDSTTDISGAWNDTDARLVAVEMINDCLSRVWLKDAMQKARAANKTDSLPRVVVGTVKNKSHEHISTETFINDIQRELTNSGRVEFVASKTERNDLREEKEDQAGNASATSRQSAGEESGAEYMMMGSINTIVDQEGGRAVIFYQINLELVQLETHKKVWIGDKKIKKFVENSSTKF